VPSHVTSSAVTSAEPSPAFRMMSGPGRMPEGTRKRIRTGSEPAGTMASLMNDLPSEAAMPIPIEPRPTCRRVSTVHARAWSERRGSGANDTA
jgi:hypothetical protein